MLRTQLGRLPCDSLISETKKVEDLEIFVEMSRGLALWEVERMLLRVELRSGAHVIIPERGLDPAGFPWHVVVSFGRPPRSPGQLRARPGPRGQPLCLLAMQSRRRTPLRGTPRPWCPPGQESAPLHPHAHCQECRLLSSSRRGSSNSVCVLGPRTAEIPSRHSCGCVHKLHTDTAVRNSNPGRTAGRAVCW